jgi:hypothetical protein
MKSRQVRPSFQEQRKSQSSMQRSGSSTIEKKDSFEDFENLVEESKSQEWDSNNKSSTRNHSSSQSKSS